MAKVKKFLPLIIIAVVSILMFAFLAAPLTRSISLTDKNAKNLSAYEYNKEMQPQINDTKKTISEIEGTIFGEKLVPVLKSSLAIYDINIAIMALSAVCFVVAVTGLVLGIKKIVDKRLYLVFTIVAILLTFGLFICGCLTLSNLSVIKSMSSSSDSFTPIAPILVLAFGLVTTCGATALTVLNTKKSPKKRKKTA